VLDQEDYVALVDGKRKELTPAKFCVVKFLLQLAPEHCSLKTLQNKTKADAPKYLRELSRDPDWAPHIHRPGRHDRKGTGYGIY
jgi:hypothetical protein